MVGKAGGNRYVFHYEAEAKSPQATADASEEQSARALSRGWTVASGYPTHSGHGLTAEGWYFTFRQGNSFIDRALALRTHLSVGSVGSA